MLRFMITPKVLATSAISAFTKSSLIPSGLRVAPALTGAGEAVGVCAIACPIFKGKSAVAGIKPALIAIKSVVNDR